MAQHTELHADKALQTWQIESSPSATGSVHLLQKQIHSSQPGPPAGKHPLSPLSLPSALGILPTCSHSVRTGTKRHLCTCVCTCVGQAHYWGPGTAVKHGKLTCSATLTTATGVHVSEGQSTTASTGHAQASVVVQGRAGLHSHADNSHGRPCGDSPPPPPAQTMHRLVQQVQHLFSDADNSHRCSCDKRGQPVRQHRPALVEEQLWPDALCRSIGEVRSSVSR